MPRNFVAGGRAAGGEDWGRELCGELLVGWHRREQEEALRNSPGDNVTWHRIGQAPYWAPYWDEIKTHLCDATTVNRPLILRSRKLDHVAQEIYGLLIAYNAVRRVTALAAAPRAIDSLRLNFTAALFRLREAIYDMMRLPASRLPDRYADLLQAIHRIRVPERPGRAYPQ